VPDIPTVTQAGFPGLTFDGLVGLYGTRDMPAALREKIAADVRDVLADPAIVSRLQATGQEVVPGSAAEFASAIDRQRAGVAETAKVLGIKAATQ
jgi:tripartite-type tricarboxylate transporter receptor subunit TctC